MNENILKLVNKNGLSYEIKISDVDFEHFKILLNNLKFIEISNNEVTERLYFKNKNDA